MSAPKRLIEPHPRDPYTVHLEIIAKAAYAYYAHSTANDSKEAKEASNTLHNALLVPIEAISQEK
jgi:hypothetical protein